MSLDSSTEQVEVRPPAMERQEGQGAMLDSWVREFEAKERIKQMKTMISLEVGFNEIEHAV